MEKKRAYHENQSAEKELKAKAEEKDKRTTIYIQFLQPIKKGIPTTKGIMA